MCEVADHLTAVAPVLSTPRGAILGDDARGPVCEILSNGRGLRKRANRIEQRAPLERTAELSRVSAARDL